MEYETVKIEKNDISCKLCEAYVMRNMTTPPKIAVLACEGACAKGEIARQAANLVAFQLAKDRTVRICLGAAFTKQAGPRDLVARAERAVIIDGCPIACSTRMLKGVLPELRPLTVLADTIHRATLPFGLDEASDSQLRDCAHTVAEAVVRDYVLGKPSDPSPADLSQAKAPGCCK